MDSEEDPVKKQQIIDARARNISHNVRCTECGSQSIEDSQADIAILLRKSALIPSFRYGKQLSVPVLCSNPSQLTLRLSLTLTELIRDEIRAGKTDKEIYKKLEDDFGETLLVAGVAAGGWAYKRHRQKTNVHIMALNLVRGVPLTPKEKQTMLELLTPPPSQGATASSWWSRLRHG
ncbi:hypothetical protein Cgig2_020505 [Carnegiea gigantea]|uniref:Cytochrome c-type biogenesis protein n=1 Tax=Carnegiea gigantea TaxID=171969 RepID=A0A9Q1KB57_9CARY|nr:hypothetical protein Cgig2_020505 [Carnegiea gigantea]